MFLEWQKERRMFNDPFRFEKMWLTHGSLEENIANWWSKDFHGPLLSRVANKLRLVKENLKVWNKETFGDIFKRKDQLKLQLTNLEVKIQENGCSKEDKTAEKILLCEWHNLLAQEETRRRQKSRLAWLKEGDRNTKFFHISTLRQRSHNSIKKIECEDESTTKELLRIKEEGVAYQPLQFLLQSPSKVFG